MTVQKKRDEECDLREKLRSAVPPMKDAELRRDLWPQMLKRIEQAPGSGLPWPMRVPWFDWALLGVASAALIFFPAVIPALLYHL